LAVLVVACKRQALVEILDRVSARRNVMNTFFLTLNGAIITAFGIFWKAPPAASPWLLLPVLVITLGQCFAWYRLVDGHRYKNALKYQIVHTLESRLPAEVFKTEWAERNRNLGAYVPITSWERWIPITFALAYAFAFVLAVSTTS
jgi:hypothetical protein